jgi:enoyl-CoA hydratase
MADILLAAPNAKFGQPEVNIGTITGGGGSQRLARCVGKSRAMELVLSGRMWSAGEAVAWGMASRVVVGSEEQQGEGGGVGAVVKEAVELAGEIAGKSQIVVQAQKEAVNAGTVFFSFHHHFFLAHCFSPHFCVVSSVRYVAYEQGLSEGLRTERRLFHMTFATTDQKEGAWNAGLPWSGFSLILTLASKAWRPLRRRENRTSPTRKTRFAAVPRVCIMISVAHLAVLTQRLFFNHT